MISGIIYMIGVIVMDFFYPALYGICGIIIGSFLNVCILRIPEGQSFVTGRSHCPACKRQLYPFDMVPVLSFLFLGGKGIPGASPISFCRAACAAERTGHRTESAGRTEGPPVDP